MNKSTVGDMYILLLYCRLKKKDINLENKF